MGTTVLRTDMKSLGVASWYRFIVRSTRLTARSHPVGRRQAGPACVEECESYDGAGDPRAALYTKSGSHSDGFWTLNNDAVLFDVFPFHLSDLARPGSLADVALKGVVLRRITVPTGPQTPVNSFQGLFQRRCRGRWILPTSQSIGSSKRLDLLRGKKHCYTVMSGLM